MPIQRSRAEPGSKPESGRAHKTHRGLPFRRQKGSVAWAAASMQRQTGLEPSFAAVKRLPLGAVEIAMPNTKAAGSFSEFVRSWRYFIFALALCLGVALFYAEETWRGHWLWGRYQARM